MATGSAEVHERWADVVFVQAGRAALVTGGRLEGETAEPGGERRGRSIAGGSERPIGTGDFVVIPAGVPHQFVLERGDTLRYLTIKVLKSGS